MARTASPPTHARRRRASSPRAALTLVLVAVAGCAGSPSETADARGAVETLLHACADDEPNVALESLTEPAHAAFFRGAETAESCAEALGLELGLLSPEEAELAFEEAGIPEVEVGDGSFGSAIVEVAGRRSEVEVELVGGRWLVNNPAVPTD